MSDSSAADQAEEPPKTNEKGGTADAPAKEGIEESVAPTDKTDINIVRFNEHIQIFTREAMPLYDQGEVKAYRARGEKNYSDQLVAMVCEPHLVPRWQNASIYSGIINPLLIRLVAAGPAYWPPAKAQRYIFLYEQPGRRRLLEPGQPAALGLKQDIVTDIVVRPLTSVLRDFKDKGFAHGQINPYNTYISDSGFKDITLGDPLSGPPSYFQPALYEPIERAVVDPIGRGMGHYADDIYSFGVFLTVLLRANDPLSGKSDDEILAQKISIGSYAALTGKDRFTGEILELLRGVLHDDRTQRWNAEEIHNWLEGQRLSPKQALKRKKAARVLTIDNERYDRPEILAHDMPKLTGHITQLIDDDKLQQWLKRSLEDEDMLTRLNQAIQTAQDAGGRTKSYKHRLGCRVAIALDPSGPIRYSGLNLRPEGFGPALARAFVMGDSLNPYTEIIQENVILFWLNSQIDRNVDVGTLITRFDACRAFIKNRNAGFGLERCLYFLYPEAPCLSEKLRRYYVRNAGEMMGAFETMCRKGELSGLFLDRHSIAFLSAKNSKILDSYLIELNAAEPHKQVLGNVWALSTIQERYETGPVPHVARHIVKMMSPVLSRFHDRRLRDRLKEEFDKIQKTGNLGRLAMILENVEIIDKDFKAFKGAMADYVRLRKEKETLSDKLKNDKESLGAGIGRASAAVFSSLLGGVMIILFAIQHFL